MCITDSIQVEQDLEAMRSGRRPRGWHQVEWLHAWKHIKKSEALKWVKAHVWEVRGRRRGGTRPDGMP